MTTLVIADDHPMILQGVVETLGTDLSFEIVATATSHTAAVAACARHQPDMVLLDLNMPGGSPFTTVEQIQQQAARSKIVAYSGYDDEVYVRGLLARGVAGYILKEESAGTLIAALHAINEGSRWYSPSITQRLVDMVASAEPPPAFSGREREILTLLVQGLTDQEIAVQLSLSVSTVRYHISNLFERLGLTSRVALAVEAVRNGWLKASD